MLEVVRPPEPKHLPQTEADAEHGRQFGRTVPAPEVLQPSLDAALPGYTPRTDTTLSGSFKGAASDVLPGLVNLWVDAFQRYYPQVHLEVAPPYAGSLGAKELAGGNLDFVFVSRELRPEDITDFRAKFGYDPFSVPVAGGSYRHYGFLDAVVFFINKANPLESISFDQLDRILSRTHVRGGTSIQTWGQLGLTGEWADKPIHVYAIRPWNGFEEFVRQRVLSVGKQRGEWRDDFHFDKVVFPIASEVANDPYGLGYAGMAYLDAPVKVLALQTPQNGAAVAPTYENVATARYPLSRLIYFNTNRQPGKPLNPVLDEFLKFILSREGQQLVVRQGIFLPLRAEQAQQARELAAGR
ncbi:MAG: PstS family phosphate ABC transporter substrate-binding protein [Terriglobales bacterium]